MWNSMNVFTLHVINVPGEDKVKWSGKMKK